jgi:hypothetical protein
MPAALDSPSGTLEMKHRGQYREADAAARQQAQPEDDGLRHPVQQRPDRDRRTATGLLLLRRLLLAGLAAGALAVPGAVPGQRGVGREVGQRAAEEADRRRQQSAGVGRLLHQVEGNGGDQHARAEGHDRGDDALGHPHEPRDQRPDDQRAPAEQPQSPASSQVGTPLPPWSPDDPQHLPDTNSPQPRGT